MILLEAHFPNHQYFFTTIKNRYHYHIGAPMVISFFENVAKKNEDCELLMLKVTIKKNKRIVFSFMDKTANVSVFFDIYKRVLEYITPAENV